MKKPSSTYKRGSYVTIMDWMVRSLKLKSNELIIYAVIHSFSQDGQSRFYGSWNYLRSWTSLSRQGVQNKLNSLIEKGYILKEDIPANGKHGRHYCAYFTTFSRLPEEDQLDIMAGNEKGIMIATRTREFWKLAKQGIFTFPQNGQNS